MSNQSLENLFKKYYGPLSDGMLKQIHLSKIKMIDPFIPNQVRYHDEGQPREKKVISYGLSSYGYDIRVAPEFKIYSNINSDINDPKEISDRNFHTVNSEDVIIPPNSYVLCRSIERFDLPRDVTGVCWGKSTYARAGLVVNVTPLEAGWCGYLTIEIANCSPLPARIYANEGICQIVFLKGTPCDVSYGDRSGKYQDQKAEIVLPRM